MFSRLTRLPLRRCIHTTPSRSIQWYPFARIALGASAATATYFTWRLTSDHNRIALDSPTSLTAVKQSSSPLASPEKQVIESPLNVHLASEASPSDPVPTSTQPDDQANKEPNAESDDAASQGVSGGAYNPVTGEINWDCPCLGGMAHGPCGPEFREAFSCFVFSEDEPKGINCVEKFKAMQTCFREHPDVYGDEIMDDDDDEEPVSAEGAIVQTSTESTPSGSNISPKNPSTTTEN